MIILNRILIKDQKDLYISIKPKKILAKTRKYYENAFKTKKSNFDLLNEDWKKEYQPSIDVKEEWFKELMELEPFFLNIYAWLVFFFPIFIEQIEIGKKNTNQA